MFAMSSLENPSTQVIEVDWNIAALIRKQPTGRWIARDCHTLSKVLRRCSSNVTVRHERQPSACPSICHCELPSRHRSPLRFLTQLSWRLFRRPRLYPRTAVIASTSSTPPARTSVIRCRATCSSNFSPRGSSDTRTHRRSSALRVRCTQPRDCSRLISSTVLLCFSPSRSANVRIVGFISWGSPRTASNNKYCCGSSPNRPQRRLRAKNAVSGIAGRLVRDSPHS
jgi:hypothetical protein